MPCDTRLRANQSLAQRMSEVDQALTRLKTQLSNGRVRVTLGPRGEMAFAGWNDRDNVSDVCAYRALTAQNSWELRRAVAAAEAMSGRKLNSAAVVSGVHSHDGGKNFHGGH